MHKFSTISREIFFIGIRQLFMLLERQRSVKRKLKDDKAECKTRFTKNAVCTK